MTKQSLLIVDGDTRSLRLLEVSLKKAGYLVNTAISGADALTKIEAGPPDLILSDTHMAEMSGFEFCRRLKQNPAWASIPFIFLTEQKDVENRIQGLELGVDDYLTKPIYLKEILSRVNILLEKNLQRGDARKGSESRTKFHGHLQDMAVVDLIQTIEIGRKAGVIHLISRDGREGAIYFRNGKVIDAEQGRLGGENAVYRLLNWNDGEFDVEFKNIRRRDVIELSSQGLLMEGMRRVDEWCRLAEQLPPLSTILEAAADALTTRLSELPDEVKGVLRLFDGRRTILDVIDDCALGDLDGLNIISRLYFEGMLVARSLETSPMEDVASGSHMESIGLLRANTEADTGLMVPDGSERASKNIIHFPSPSGGQSPGRVAAKPTLEPNRRDLFAGSAALAPASRAHVAPVPIPAEADPVRGPTPLAYSPHFVAEPSVIVNIKDSQGSVRTRDFNAPLAPFNEDAEGPAEQTERIGLSPPPQTSLFPYFLSSSLIAAGLLLGVFVLGGRRTPSPPAAKSTDSCFSAIHPSDGSSAEVRPPALAPAPFVKPPPLLPTSAAPTDQQKYSALVKQARAAYQQGSLASASQFLRRASALNSNDPDAIALQAMIALGQDNPSRAAELARKALSIQDNSADAHLVLGTIEQMSNHVSAARAHFEKYLALAPQGENADEIRGILSRLK